MATNKLTFHLKQAAEQGKCDSCERFNTKALHDCDGFDQRRKLPCVCGCVPESHGDGCLCPDCVRNQFADLFQLPAVPSPPGTGRIGQTYIDSTSTAWTWNGYTWVEIPHQSRGLSNSSGPVASTTATTSLGNVPQGETYTQALQFHLPDGTPYDLTGSRVVAVEREAQGSRGVQVEVTVTDPSNGEVVVRVPGSETLKMVPAKYSWDLNIQAADWGVTGAVFGFWVVGGLQVRP